MTQYEFFKGLHTQKEPLLIGNVWNAQSAKVYETLNFKAIGTSSAAIAKTLGYEDGGEQLPFNDLLFLVEKIKSATTLPLTVDIEAGYGKNADKIATNIVKLHKLGIIGINIEDSFVLNGVRQLKDAVEYSSLLATIVKKLSDLNVLLFINVRCDTFLLDCSNKLEETVKRIKLYEQANIDGIFLPCLTQLNDIKAVVKSTSLPINVMCMPELPNFETLKALGVKRVSMGNFLNDCIYSTLETMTKNILQEKSFSPLFK